MNILAKASASITLIAFSFSSCEAKVLTMNEALAIADKNNLQAKAASSQVDVIKAEELIAGAIRDPALVSDNGIISEQTFRPIGLEGTFELGGKRHGRIEVAKSLTKEAFINAQAIFKDIHVQVHKAYAELAIAQDRLKLAQDKLDTAQKIYEQISIRSDVGDSSGLDLLRAKSSLDLNKIDLEKAKTDLSKAQIKLSALLNLSKDNKNNNIEVQRAQELGPKDNKKLSLEEIKAGALSENPEINLLKTQIETGEATLNLAKRQFIPDLTLAAGPSISLGDPLGVFLTGRINLPFFGEAKGQIAKAYAQINKLNLEEKSLKNKIESEIDLAYQEFKLAESNYFTYKNNLLNQANELEEMINFGIQKGAFRLTELFTLQNETRQLREKYLQTLLDYQFAIADLEKALGRHLSGLETNV